MKSHTDRVKGTLKTEFVCKEDEFLFNQNAHNKQKLNDTAVASSKDTTTCSGEDTDLLILLPSSCPWRSTRRPIISEAIQKRK